MKSPLFGGRHRHGEESVAIVSVLILVVLITAVLLAFLISSSIEQASSRSYKASSNARLLADMTINLVQGEINEATSQGQSYAWASQPGAIRVYDNTGALTTIYKLYSAQNLTTASVSAMNVSNTAPGSNDMPPTGANGWNNTSAQWVDLNASASDAQGTTHYPIMDPTVASGVDGFSINTTSGLATSTSVPMPVRWLYVLQNGQIIAPDSGITGNVLTFLNATVQPSAANPIVGRVAYWTDDETTKININTAGGDGQALNGTNVAPIANATFWDTPHWGSPDDTNFAVIQPVSGEYQRYPGHPATVPLNNILLGLGWNLGAAPSTNFYTLTPRYAVGGSKAATVVITGITNGIISPMVLNPSPQNRLYSSVAEMLFTNNGTSDRVPSFLNANNAVTAQRIETARFFLTAHSEAPEVSLFGQPRVSMWPVWSTSTPNTNTLFDNVLKFSATVPGTTPSTYYFTRKEPTSNSTDIMLKEINTGTANPYRNQVLLNYLDYYTSQSIPGYGGTFSTKYAITGSSGTRQILTEAFDYIRTINEADTSQFTNGAKVSSNPWIYVHPWQGVQTVNSTWGEFQVTPSVINSVFVTNAASPIASWTSGSGYQGYGAYPRLNEVGIEFVGMGRGAISYTDASGTANNPNFPSGSQAIYLGTNYETTTYISTNYLGLGDSGVDPNNSSGMTNYITKDTNQFLPSPPYPASTPNLAWNHYVSPGNISNGSATTTEAVQAFLFLCFSQPSQMLISDGINSTSGGAAQPQGRVQPFLWVEITGLDGFKVSTPLGGNTLYPLGFPHDDVVCMNGAQYAGWDEVNWRDTIIAHYVTPGVLVKPGSGTTSAQTANPFYSKILPLAISRTTGTGNMTFQGGPITIKLYDGSGGYGFISSAPAASRLVQTYTINFGLTNGSYSTLLPIPSPVMQLANNMGYTVGVPASLGIGSQPSTNVALGITNLGTGSQDRWASTIFLPTYPFPQASDLNSEYITKSDVMQSMVLATNWSDIRMLAMSNVPASAFVPHPRWGTTNNSVYIAANSTNAATAWAYSMYAYDKPWQTFSGSSYTDGLTHNVIGVLNPYSTYWNGAAANAYGVPTVSSTVTPNYITNNFGTNGQRMDWDSGMGNVPDGPWINKVDEGQYAPIAPYWNLVADNIPVDGGFFSPNREVPSPAVMGSLPTGVDPTGANPSPWRTLLFRPNPGHYGASPSTGGTAPADHLMLDLFWMPQAEPYAISEPFTSLGKINLNYQIQPFTYITRSTAVRALLSTQKIACVPAAVAVTYPSFKNLGGYTKNTRYPLNLAATMAQFDDKFNGVNNSGVNLSGTGSPDIFRSASQLCEMYLVPNGTPNFTTPANSTVYSTASAFATEWLDGKTYGLVGDNVREKPYANIYGQVTTKSNTYTVYLTVQSLKNGQPASNQSVWDESRGTVLGEYRGATMLERYIDPNESLPDFAATPGSATLDGTPTTRSYYRWRVVENHQFAP